MTITKSKDMKIITPTDGYLLTNGDVISDIIFVGINSPIENWSEIPISSDNNYEDNQN